MTTPDERRRNLIWGHEALTEFAQDEALPADWRVEAERLLSSYPPLARLQADDGDLERLQEEFIDVLCASKWLFTRVRTHPTTNNERRYSLLVILRHFV
jgi:hypothetical protein